MRRQIRPEVTPSKKFGFHSFPESWCHGEWTLIDRIFSDMSVSVIFQPQLMQLNIIGISYRIYRYFHVNIFLSSNEGQQPIALDLTANILIVIDIHEIKYPLTIDDLKQEKESISCGVVALVHKT